ncbi:hypothetical protein [Pseudobutyrivibrio sp.]|nr:hypothetical protein [Pseudobutyrivibrio sp.]
MARTNIRIVKFYDGSRIAKEVMNDAIASKVRKKLDIDIEYSCS